jgi:predicted kinase
VPRLILLNGAPASGKSTLARLWWAAHPRSVLVDVDAVRATVSGWLDDPLSGLLPRRMALATIDTALDDDRDVIVPQFLAKPEFADALAAVAARRGAPFVEVVLVADPDELERRFAARSAAPETGEHADAAALQARVGGDVREQQERMLALAATRAGVIRIPSAPGEIDATLAALTAAIDGARFSG